MANALNIGNGRCFIWGECRPSINERDEKSKARGHMSLRLAEQRTAVGVGSFCTWTTTFSIAFGTTASKNLEADPELSSLLEELNSS